MTINPSAGAPALPDTSTLMPEVHPLADGATLYALPSATTELLRLDLLHEAGTAYQPQPLCAAAANRLFSVASPTMDAAAVAEFLDYRGIVLEHNPDILTCTTTLYFLRRYLDELLPVLNELLREPAFPQDDFDVYCRKRKQEIQALRLKSNEVARRLFYQSLFGPDHPLGRYAEPDDADRLTREVVMRYYRERYTSMNIVLSGNLDSEVIEKVNRLAALSGMSSFSRISSLSKNSIPSVPTCLSEAIPGAVQTTLRVGRVLPLRWDDPDYAYFMLLTTLLGGYFGSRLMSNLREDKGFTYSVVARTQIYRGTIVFYLTADLAAGTADAAEAEVRRELQRLTDEPVGADELALVKTVMAGDFIRSVDGIFERAERLCGMLNTHVTERLTDNLRRALAEADPDRLQALARRLLSPDDMTYCRAGAM